KSHAAVSSARPSTVRLIRASLPSILGAIPEIRDPRRGKSPLEIPTLSLAWSSRSREASAPWKRGWKPGMRTREGQVDPCSELASKLSAEARKLSQRQAAPCLGDFRQLASPERTSLRN
ncbi:hypothetical protein K0M31_016475, partial [Melipona bicolor]